MTEETKKTRDWFLSAFGGTIIGIVGILLGTILSNLSGQVATLRTEVSVTAGKVAAGEGRTELYKERFTELELSMKTVKEQLSQLEQIKEVYREKFETLNKMIDLLKETEKELKTEIKLLTEKIPPPISMMDVIKEAEKGLKSLPSTDPTPAEKSADPNR